MSRAVLPRDQEDRAMLALGSLDCLDDLLANQIPNATIPAEPLACLLRVITVSIRAAIPGFDDMRPGAINDDDVE